MHIADQSLKNCVASSCHMNLNLYMTKVKQSTEKLLPVPYIDIS